MHPQVILRRCHAKTRGLSAFAQKLSFQALTVAKTAQPPSGSVVSDAAVDEHERVVGVWKCLWIDHGAIAIVKVGVIF